MWDIVGISDLLLLYTKFNWNENLLLKPLSWFLREPVHQIKCRGGNRVPHSKTDGGDCFSNKNFQILLISDLHQLADEG